MTSQKHSSSKLREKNSFGSGGKGIKLTRSSSVGGFISSYDGDGTRARATLEVLRHEIASRQLADASATTSFIATKTSSTTTTTTTGDISTMIESGVVSARPSVARQGKDETSAIKEGIEEGEEEEEFYSSRQGLQNLDMRSSVVPDPVDVGVDGMLSQEGVAIVGLKVGSSAGVTAVTVGVGMDGEGRNAPVEEPGEDNRSAGGERREGYGGKRSNSCLCAPNRATRPCQSNLPKIEAWILPMCVLFR